MSVPSELPDTQRRVPRRPRGEARVAELLAAAAAVIGENGYEATTLTAVAARAGASIGALYQYFSNKETVAHALLAQYGGEIANLWKPLMADAVQLSVKGLVGRMLDTLAAFLEARPAYLPLLEAPPGSRYNPDAKNQLEEHLADLFRAKRPDLTPKKALRIANVVFQVIKGMTVLSTREKEERRKLLREFKRLLTAYLGARLHA